ncbi:MAG: urea ABC transporter ATP-binding protein UrtD [Dehalococcoidia bacterium]|nr:urea ABC transporter ATP-binding protein UrtD [Dehalococcoidia bacterium]
MPENKILVCEDVSVAFDGFTVLDHLNFSIDYAELRFLIGPNGAGKTTLLDIITGKTRPQSGRVFFDCSGTQVDVLRHQEHYLVRRGIGRKFQTPAVFSSLTVFQNLAVAVSYLRNPTAVFRAINRQDFAKVMDTLEKVGLTARSEDKAGSLSHGEQQWLEIAILLVQESKLLLLDEPVAGMTRPERERTGELLRSIGNDRSVLVVEHDMEFVRQFANTVTVLHLGKVLSEGPMELVQQDPEVIQAYLGHNKARVLQDASAAGH